LVWVEQAGAEVSLNNASVLFESILMQWA